MSRVVSRVALATRILQRLGGRTMTADEVRAAMHAAWSVVWRTLRGMVQRGQAVRLEDGRYRLGILEG